MTKPPSDATKIVFGYDVATSDFSKAEYSPTLYGNYIQQPEIDSFFDRMKQIPEYTLPKYWIILIFAALIWIGGFIFMITSFGRSSAGSGPNITPIIVMPITFFISVSICCVTACLYNSANAKKKLALEAFLAADNVKIQGRGLRWEINPHMAYFIMHLDCVTKTMLDNGMMNGAGMGMGMGMGMQNGMGMGMQNGMGMGMQNSFQPAVAFQPHKF